MNINVSCTGRHHARHNKNASSLYRYKLPVMHRIFCLVQQFTFKYVYLRAVLKLLNLIEHVKTPWFVLSRPSWLWVWMTSTFYWNTSIIMQDVIISMSIGAVLCSS